MYNNITCETFYNKKYNTYIIAFCPNTLDWFVSNERFFFYEFEKEFNSEIEAEEFFIKNKYIFLDIENKIMKDCIYGYKSKDYLYFNKKIIEVL